MMLGMGLRSTLLVFAASICLAPSALAAGLPPTAPPPPPHGRALATLAAHEGVLLAVKPGKASERLIAGQGGYPVSRTLGLWRVGGGASIRLVPQLEARGLLRYAEPDRPRLVEGHLDQGDPLLDKAWQIARVGADATEPPSGGVPLAIIDTGLDVTNPDFAGRPETTLLDAQTVGDLKDESYHGTIVASTAAAAANGVGTVGIQPYVPLRIWDLASLDDSAIIAALDSVSRGCPQVINLSIGGPGFSRSLYEAVMRAVNRGCLLVAASGNSYLDGNPEIFPASAPHVLTVAAVDQSDAPAPFSSGAKSVDLAAPGMDIPVQSPDSPTGYALADGTSFAAPIVSAAASWIWTQRHDLDATQLFELLRVTAHDVYKAGFDTRTGFGLLSVPDALTASAPQRDPGEPNDDIDLVRAGGVFRSARPALGAGISARLNSVEDPHDVYRVVIPAGRTVTVTAVPQGEVDVALWSGKTRSIRGSKSYRIAVSSNPAGQAQTVAWRNASKRPATIYVDLWIPQSTGGKSASYVLEVKTA
jgi:hypothetical protein